MEGDGKAVHLVLYAFEQMEECALLLQPDAHRGEAEEELGCAVAVVLGQAGNGDVQPQRVFHHFADDLHLSLATVGNDEVGEGSALGNHTRVAAIHHLAHRGIVVGAHDGLDIILAILLLAGLAHSEDDAGGHGIGARDVGVVKTLDVNGHFVELEVLLYLLEQACALLLGVELVGLLQAVELVLLYVEQRKVEQFLAVAALRHDEGDALQVDVHGEGHYNLLRLTLVALAHLHDAQREQLLARLVHLLLILEGEGLVDGSVGDVQVVDEGAAVVLLDGEHVHVVDDVAHHLALLAEALQGIVLALQLHGLLEAHLLAQAAHLVHQATAQLLGVATQDFPDFTDLFHVFIVALQRDARSLATLDMIVEAGLELAAADVLGSEREVTRAHRIELLDEPEYLVERRDMAVGAEVLRAVADNLAGLEHLGEILAGDADGGVRLIVLEQHVVARLVLLDEVVLEQQCILLALHHHVANIGDLTDENTRLSRLLLLEILAHAPLQILCLTHINHRALLVEILIAPRRVGQVLHNGLQVGIFL